MAVRSAGEVITECQEKAQRSLARNYLATQAFGVACARHDWATAEREEQRALDALREHMDAVQAVYRMAEAM
jgi:hypothetical protein